MRVFCRVKPLLPEDGGSFKDDVKEVKNGLECGIKLGKFNDYQKGDIIECYELEKLEQSL